jgi:hypothetical protein
MLSKRLFLSSIVLFVLLGSPLVVLVEAEPSWVIWSQTYGGTKEDCANSLIETYDGGYALAGNTRSFGAEDEDFWLVKTDGTGNMEWNQTYGEGAVSSLIETSDRGYAMAGGTRLVKIDKYGNMMWNQTYGQGTVSSLIETSDGGYALAGKTTTFVTGVDDYGNFWLIKTDAYGNMMWNRTYGGEDYDYACALVEASDGGYILAGTTCSFGAGNWDVWLIKTDAYGIMEWNQTYGGAGEETAFSLVPTSDGGYAIAGSTYPIGEAEDFWLIKTDVHGNMEWNRTYGEVDNFDVAHTLVETSDGGYALAGGTGSFSIDEYDVWLVKTDGAGNMEWNHTYGGEKGDIANSLVETSNGGYVIAGSTRTFGAGEEDFWLIKTNEQGVPEFPSWAILPLLLVATLAAMVYKQKLAKHHAY